VVSGKYIGMDVHPATISVAVRDYLIATLFAPEPEN
jgi:hypothetical protein